MGNVSGVVDKEGGGRERLTGSSGIARDDDPIRSRVIQSKKGQAMAIEGNKRKSEYSSREGWWGALEYQVTREHSVVKGS